MAESVVLDLVRDLFYTALLLALPALAASLLVGLVISVLQTVTSVQEQTLSFAPRIAVVAIILVLTLGWAAQIAVGFTVRMLDQAAVVTR
jgi:flagellar biosynthetic protein FliQ